MSKANRFGDLPTFEGHNDAIILQRIRGDAMDLAVPDPTYEVDLPRLVQGGLQGAFMMAGSSRLRESLVLIDAVYQVDGSLQPHRRGARHELGRARCHRRRLPLVPVRGRR